MIKMHLPMPPTDNRYYGKPKGSRHKFLTKEAKLFRKAVGGIVMKSGLQGHFGTDNVGIKVVLHLAYGGDIWNRCKGLGDALQYSTIIENDSQIKHSIIEIGSPARPGRMDVTLWRL